MPNFLTQPKNWLDLKPQTSSGDFSFGKRVHSLWAFGFILLTAGLVGGLTISSYPEIAQDQSAGLTLGYIPTGRVLGAETLPGLADDGRTYPPPTSGTYAYNSFIPAGSGATYIDPIFGSTVRRLSSDSNADDSYARNMWWNADGTKYMHRTKNESQWPDYWNIIDTATGQITHRGIPIGNSSAADAGFDPIDPNVLYKYSDNKIIKVVLNADGTWTESTYFTAPSAIKSLGGTLNWMDAAGRYMVVRYGNEPSVYLYDRNNFAAGPYANPVDASDSVDLSAYMGISPDGQYLVGYDSDGGFGFGEGISYKIDHANRSVGSRNRFWSLCGDHGTFLSASDGRDYMIVSNCYDSPDIWRVDITNNAAGPLAVSLQKLLPNNKKLLTFPSWNNGVHFSSVAKGTMKDWVFISTEDNRDVFNGGTSFWEPYTQEIIGINVLTGEIKRIAHHRSRSMSADYYNTPRLTTSWGGEYVGWNSNFNQSGKWDVYSVPFATATGTTAPPPPPPPANDTTAPTISNVSVTNLTSLTASINWSTDEAATGQVEYCQTSSHCGVYTPLVSTLALDHIINILVLQPSTKYYYWITSKDAAGNTAVSPRLSLTSPKDITRPQILSFDAQASVKADIFGSATDSGGSYLGRAIINRAVYSDQCNESVKTKCAWRKIKTLYAPKNSDSWNFSYSDSPARGTYWYGVHITDNNGNTTYEPNPPGPIKVQIGG